MDYETERGVGEGVQRRGKSKEGVGWEGKRCRMIGSPQVPGAEDDGQLSNGYVRRLSGRVLNVGRAQTATGGRREVRRRGRRWEGWKA